MDQVVTQIIASVISGLVGGIITGIAAWSAIKVEMRYMRRDIDHAHARIDNIEGTNGNSNNGGKGKRRAYG